MKCMWCKKQLYYELTPASLFQFRSIKPFNRCTECNLRLEELKGYLSCPMCSRKQSHDSVCEDCQNWQRIYPERDFSHKSLFHYDGIIKEWLIQFKYLKDYRLKSFLRPELQKELLKYSRDKTIVPIPISGVSLQSRNFNQMTAMLDDASIPYLNLLQCFSDGKKQSEKSKEERMESEQCFLVDSDQLHLLSDEEVILVDDVYTTGRTLNHARDALASHSRAKIETWSVARS